MIDLAETKIPGPTITPLTARFWEAAENGQLLIQRCTACARPVFYPRPLCPHCWSPSLMWEQASGRGRLKSFSVVHKPGHPGWLPAVPYVVGLVELKEGPKMTSLILTSDAKPSIGATLQLDCTNIGGRLLPAFRITSTKEPQ